MSNMSYCRFENTYRDLVDCSEALDRGDMQDLSASEQKYRNRLVELCKQIADDHDIEEETNEEE